MLGACLAGDILKYIYLFLFFIYTMFLEGNTFSSNSHSTKGPSIKDV